ncbi:hypothetical protein V8B97DRAFT_1922054 [Scleroderma yunnanense]
MVTYASRCSFSANVVPWAGIIIWWSVQGILQMRLYALYHGSKKLLVFMLITFITEVGTVMWILISTNLVNDGALTMVHISFDRGHKQIDTCSAPVSATFTYIWVPCLVFEIMLCLFATYAGIKHSGVQWCQAGKFARFQLIDVLIQGNVIYFLGPFVMFVLLGINSPNPMVQELANILFLKAPITIIAGCRLILSIRKTASSLQSHEIPVFWRK